MPRPQKKGGQQPAPANKATPTFLLELPLAVTPGQASRLRAHLGAARQLYNAVLSEGQRRLRRMRADPAWQAAREIPRTEKLERQRAFGALRQRYGFSEHALHDAAKGLRCTWIAEHVDAVLAQTLASRAYRALNRVCLGQARRVRFRSKSRGISSVENKRNDTGMRFVLQQPEEGNRGYLMWQDDALEALIDWHDPVVQYGLDHRVKYARLIQRQTTSPRAAGADTRGYRYSVQLALEGVPYHKPKHRVAPDTVGLDLGPSTLAIVPREGTPRLGVLCAELAPDEQAIRRLQRQMDRQRRANNPDNYDVRRRIKKPRNGRLSWKHSKRYQSTRRRKATRERKLAAHRKSLHGRLVHEIVAVGDRQSRGRYIPVSHFRGRLVRRLPSTPPEAPLKLSRPASVAERYALSYLLNQQAEADDLFKCDVALPRLRSRTRATTLPSTGPLLTGSCWKASIVSLV